MPSAKRATATWRRSCRDTRSASPRRTAPRTSTSSRPTATRRAASATSTKRRPKIGRQTCSLPISYPRKRKVLTMISYTTWKLQRKFLDAEREASYRDVEAQLPGYEISFTSTNRAEDKYIVATYSDKTRGQRYLYEKATKDRKTDV